MNAEPDRKGVHLVPNVHSLQRLAIGDVVCQAGQHGNLVKGKHGHGMTYTRLDKRRTHSVATSSAHSWHMSTMISSPAGTTTTVGMSNLPRIFGLFHHDFPVLGYQSGSKNRPAEVTGGANWNNSRGDGKQGLNARPEERGPKSGSSGRWVGQVRLGRTARES